MIQSIFWGETFYFPIKHPHNMMLPPLCFTLCMVVFGLKVSVFLLRTYNVDHYCKTIWFCVSSDQRTLLQKVDGYLYNPVWLLGSLLHESVLAKAMENLLTVHAHTLVPDAFSSFSLFVALPVPSSSGLGEPFGPKFIHSSTWVHLCLFSEQCSVSVISRYFLYM